MWIRRIFRLLPQFKVGLVRATLMVVLIEAFKLVPPYLLKMAIDILLEPSPSAVAAYTVVGAILVVYILTSILEGRRLITTAKMNFDIEADILRRGQEKLLSLGLKFHESRPSGDLVHLMTKGSSRLAELSYFIQDQFLGATIQLILTSAMMFFVDLRAGLVFVLFMPLAIMLAQRTFKEVQPFRRRYHRVFRQATWEMNQSLMNVRTVKDYAQELREQGNYSRLLEDWKAKGNERIKYEADSTRWYDLTLGVARLSVFFYTVHQALQGAMSTGTMVLFMTLSEKVVASIYRLGRLYSFLGDAMESIDQFSRLFVEKNDIIESPNALPCAGPNGADLRGEVEFDAVSFSYSQGIPVLVDINLKLAAKSVTAVVGRSGSGKSSLVKLLSRHYDVTEGKIKVDGVDIRDFKVAQYRRQVAVVSQDIEIFDKSVRENIAYGRDATAGEVEQAARAANAHEFILSLKDGYETRLGERGVKLSGGQKQRIGIARALIMKPAILIFDEATSSLDTESERLIQEALINIFRRQTVIIVAHRLSTIENADTIVVLDDGRVAEVGTNEELMAQGGIFARMRRLQSLGAVRD